MKNKQLTIPITLKTDVDTQLVKSPFDDDEILAVGFHKVKGKKGMYLNYTIHIKNNQITSIEYGQQDYVDVAEQAARYDFVQKLILKENQ